jgi:small subunit ribosomal protein S5
MVRATIDGLKKEVSPRIIARRRGKKLSAIVVKDEEQKELSA